MRFLGGALRYEKREHVAGSLKILVPLLGVLAAFILCAFVIVGLGYNPAEVYMRLLRGGFGSLNRFFASVSHGIPLMLCGLGVAVAFRMSVNNIGAEGQFAMGAFAATGIALFCPGIPLPALIPVMILSGFLAGALWGMLAVAPRAFLGVSETIITLLFNYIALLWIDYLCYGAWRDYQGTNMPYTRMFGPEARLASLGGTRIHSGIFLAFVAAILIYLFYKHMVRGYQMRVIGASAKAARYAGFGIRANMLLAMLVSGGLAGIAGVTYVAGISHRLQPDIAGGAGYTAITVAFLARFNPFLVLLIAVLFGGLRQGGYSVQILGLSSSVVTMIEGAILLCVLGGEVFLRNRVVLLRRHRETGDSKEEAVE